MTELRRDLAEARRAKAGRRTAILVVSGFSRTSRSACRRRFGTSPRRRCRWTATRGEGARSPATFTTKSTVPGSSRALGWDTMLPTSSCGERMSPRAFGHVGFTGTSLWLDPGRDRYFVLLTNRVCGGGTLEEMRTVRRAFHDALGDV